MKTLITTFFFFVFISYLQSQTILVSGAISTNTTWNADTVKITGNVTVMQGIELIVAPGTYVESQGFYKIYVNGSIKAIGSPADSIVFTVRDTTGFWQNEYSVAGGWAGIKLNDTITAADTSIFEFCRIQYTKKYDVNNEDIQGGAIMATNYGTLIIRNSLLRCNMVINHNYGSANVLCSKGGAVFCSEVNSVLILNNKFERNRSFDMGGAVYIGTNVDAGITNNIFIHNKAWNTKLVSGVMVSWGSGAAIETYDIYGHSPKIAGNQCFNNFVVDGVIRSANPLGLIYNNVVCNNYGTGISAAFQLSMVRIFNNTVVNNDTHMGGINLFAYAKVYNNIVWGNESYPGEVIDQIGLCPGFAYPVIFNNCVESGTCGTNGIKKYPEFVSPTKGVGLKFDGTIADWTLKDLSPCINSGTRDSTGLFIPEYDIIGNQRIYGVSVDMGCFENQVVLLGNPEAEVKNNSMSIFPNPGKGQLNIESKEPESYFELYTNSGQVIMQKHITIGMSVINTEALNPGIYFYRLKNSNNEIVATGKWIKSDW